MEGDADEGTEGSREKLYKERGDPASVDSASLSWQGKVLSRAKKRGSGKKSRLKKLAGKKHSTEKVSMDTVN